MTTDLLERFDDLGLELPFASEREAREAMDGETLLEDLTESPFERMDPAWVEVAKVEAEWLESSEVAGPEPEAWMVEAFDPEDEALAEHETIVETPAEFANRLGKQWSSLRGGLPSPDDLRDWLLRDHQETLDGAQLRWKGKFGQAAISRAWMISRQEQMHFQTTKSGLRQLSNFAPPAAAVDLVTDPLIDGSDKAPVAPITVRFVNELRRRFKGAVSASNYRGHGGGKFLNRGYSLDLFLRGRDERGFYHHQDSIALLRAVNGAAKAVQAQWRIIYNDFAVADAINREMGRTHVIFVGTVRRDKTKRVAGLNWHGPQPLILHFHLDLAPLSGAGQGEATDHVWEADELEDFEAEDSPANSFEGCSASQKILLADVAGRALASVRRASSFVGSAYGRPDRMSATTRRLLLQHFHTTDRKHLRTILTNLMRIGKAFEQGIRFKCERQCKAGPAGMECGFAYTTQWFGGKGKVSICFDTRPGHCNFETLPQHKQDAIVIHEVAHRYVGIDDHAYVHVAGYAKLSADDAVDNADSYSYFAVDRTIIQTEASEPEAEGRDGEALAWLDFESPSDEDQFTQVGTAETEWTVSENGESWSETEDESQGEGAATLDSFGGLDEAAWAGLAEPETHDLSNGEACAGCGRARFSGEPALEASKSDEQWIEPESLERTSANCTDYPDVYRKMIRRRGTAQGEVMDRTVGDRAVNLSLQFRDYDVNAYLAGEKSAHSAGLAQLTEFIDKRASTGSVVAVTITGSASRTGTKAYNDDLSRRRATCFAQFLKVSLSPRVLARTTFNISGEGFMKATCNGADCELPGFRSVLVSIHAPGRPPEPVPPEPQSWDKYSIRCCSFHSQFLGEALIDDLLAKLPPGLPRGVADKLLPVMKKRMEALLKRLLRSLPKLSVLTGDLNRLLKFLPVEITRQTAVFQIRERDKPDPRTITLCYTGFGGRLALPIPGRLEDAVEELLKRVPFLRTNDTIRSGLKKLIVEELQKVLPQSVTKFLQKLDSDVPGPFKPFDLNRRERLEVFKGDADLFVDVITNLGAPGHIFLAFDGPNWRNLDKHSRVMLTCEKCDESVIAVQVDGGVGFDMVSVNKGKLSEQGCTCVEAPSRELSFEYAG